MKSFPYTPLFIAAGLAMAASGCATPRAAPEAVAAKTPSEQFPFQVGEWADETLLAVHTQGVSVNQAAAITTAVAGWREAGGETVIVRTPVGNAQDGAAAAMTEQVRSVLQNRGVPYAAVRLERYEANGDPAAPLVLAFTSYRAKVPECGKTWDNLTATKSNDVHSNFGCAVSANMAAQVANPRDLVQARAADPSDASRAAVQVDLYRRGQDTAAAVKNDGGNVSQAVQ